MKLPWSRDAKPVTTDVVIREPVDRLARRVLAPLRNEFMSRAELRQERDEFEARLQRLLSGEQVQIRATDRKQMQKIFVVLAVAYPKLSEAEAKSLASWVLDLRPSTVEHFFNEWLAQYEKIEQEIKATKVRFRIDATSDDGFEGLANRIAAIDSMADVKIDYGLSENVKHLETIKKLLLGVKR